MGRQKKSEAEKLAEGNPGKRDIPPEFEISIPKQVPSGLTPKEKKYWRLWAKHLIALGKLTVVNVPGLKQACVIAAALDDINESIHSANQSLLQEKVYIDPTGTEHSEYKESAYSKMRRDYSRELLKFLIRYGLTPDKMAGLYKPKKEKDAMETMLD